MRAAADAGYVEWRPETHSFQDAALVDRRSRLRLLTDDLGASIGLEEAAHLTLRQARTDASSRVTHLTYTTAKR